MPPLPDCSPWAAKLVPCRAVIQREQAFLKIAKWARKNGPEFLAGGAVGWITKFGLAKLALVTPGFAAAVAASPVAATLVTAIGVGAVAGGITRLALTAFFHAERKRGKHWRLTAFAQGLLGGALGGLIGLEVSGLLRGDDVLHLVGNAEAKMPALATSSITQIPLSLPEAPLVAVAAPLTVGQAALHDFQSILAPEKIAQLPERGPVNLRALAQAALDSADPHKVARAAKEISYRWILDHPRDPTTLKMAEQLIKSAATLAHEAGLQTATVHKLDADLSHLHRVLGMPDASPPPSAPHDQSTAVSGHAAQTQAHSTRHARFRQAAWQNLHRARDILRSALHPGSLAHPNGRDLGIF